MTDEQQIKQLMKQFGEDVPIKDIAQYAEDEYFIPYKEAVRIIYDSVESRI